MHIILKWDSPSNVSKIVWNIATLNEVEWITKKRFGRRNFTRIKTKQNRQNLQVSVTLVKSKKPLGCLISKLCASLLTYILIYGSKDTHIHFRFLKSLHFFLSTIGHIRGGKDTKEGELPFQALLGHKSDGRMNYNCGGTLINRYLHI